MKDLTYDGLHERTWQLLSFATSEDRIESEYRKYVSEPDLQLYGSIQSDELVGCIGIQLTGSSSCPKASISLFVIVIIDEDEFPYLPMIEG